MEDYPIFGSLRRPRPETKEDEFNMIGKKINSCFESKLAMDDIGEVLDSCFGAVNLKECVILPLKQYNEMISLLCKKGKTIRELKRELDEIPPRQKNACRPETCQDGKSCFSHRKGPCL